VRGTHHAWYSDALLLGVDNIRTPHCLRLGYRVRRWMLIDLLTAFAQAHDGVHVPRILISRHDVLFAEGARWRCRRRRCCRSSH
jgi:hypothetical protein